MPINRDRIIQVIDHIENPRPDQPALDMTYWFQTRKGRETGLTGRLLELVETTTCGTAACLAGTTVWLFRDIISDRQHDDSVRKTAADLLGLDDHQSHHLFFARWREPSTHLAEVTPNEVVTELRKLLDA